MNKIAEISNGMLSLLVVAALAIVVANVFVLFSNQDRFGLTGYATSDTGYVNLTINQTLAIQVDSSFRTIVFGYCTPQAGTSYWCATNDSSACSTSPTNGNCTGDTTTPQYIRLDNVGNVDANITNMTSECTASTLIGGTSPGFTFITTACNGTGVSSWTSFSTGGQNVCTNLSYLGGQLQVYANVTIPFNAVGSNGACTGNSSDITFTATLHG